MATLSVEPNEHITFKVVYADDDLVVVNKPPHVPSQPGKGHERDTILNGLFASYGELLQNLGAARDYGLLHRLDKEASGLLIVALRPRAYDNLREQFHNRSIKKYYWAVCAKAPAKPSGVIKLPIVEKGGTRSEPKTALISRTGKPAVTAYRVLDGNQLGALIEARPVSGRLHQVRVHLDAIGSTILSDAFYGPKALRSAAPRLALHAYRVGFRHPTTGEEMDIRCHWPADLRRVLSRLGLKRPDLGPARSRLPDAQDPEPTPDPADAR